MIYIGIILLNLIRIYEIIILISCILSWIPGINNRFTDFIFTITDFVLNPIRSAMDKITNGRVLPIDISPIIAFLLFRIIVTPLIKSIFFGFYGIFGF